MRIETRKILNKAFTGVGFFSIFIMAAVLMFLLIPICWKGSQAYYFKSTVEFRRFELDKLQRGDKEELTKELEEVEKVRKPIWDGLKKFSTYSGRKKLRSQLMAANEGKYTRTEAGKKIKSVMTELNKRIRQLLGPAPGEKMPVLIRQRFGSTRWDLTEETLHKCLYREDWIPVDQDQPLGELRPQPVSRIEELKGTDIGEVLTYLDENIEGMMKPRSRFYWQFLIDKSFDSHILGGIGVEVVGTLYLTLGAILFAIPFGVIAAIYLCEYAKPSPMVTFLRSCISTLAGVPSIVFGLFGSAFFIYTCGLPKSLLVGSMTLALMILPTIIRASEEAILAVPVAYKEASLGLGASRWHTVMTVTLPAALPGILTGIVLSMGRAAGETAPIIMTAAVSSGAEIMSFWGALTEQTQALPWNIYNICTEHEAVDQIRHVQYGMVFTLIAVVLLLNLSAIILRARVSKNLKGA